MMSTTHRPLVISPRYEGTGELLKRVRLAEHLGIDQVWLEQQPDQRDALITAAAYLQAAPSVSVGTAVLPVYARHPVAMAQAAGTLAEFSSGRFILGLGYSHKFVNEYVLGMEQGPPIGVMREYTDIVRRLLTRGEADTEGVHFTAHAQYTDPPGSVPLYLAALRPQMIRLAVQVGQGIIIWLSSLRYIQEEIMPVVRAACVESGKNEEDFTVLTILPTYCGGERTERLAQWEKSVASYRMLPYYRHVLDAHGKPSPEELALIGPPEAVGEWMSLFRSAGCVPVPAPMSASDEDFISAVEACYPDD